MRAALQANKQRPVHIWTMFQRSLNMIPDACFTAYSLRRSTVAFACQGWCRHTSKHVLRIKPIRAVSIAAKLRRRTTSPYPRQEFTSSQITASFVIHLSTLKGYGLDENKNRFLKTWAMYKIDRFLHQYLRLRTACEFEVASLSIMLDGQPKNLGAGDGKWPSSTDIQTAFTAASRYLFPMQH